MVKANLSEVKDLGMQVNRLNTNQLVDHCILRFKAEDGTEYDTYPLTKTCHASSRLGKIIRTLLGRGLVKTDYQIKDSLEVFDSDVLIGKSALLVIENNTITGVVEAR
jgi:hypothetical protein